MPFKLGIICLVQDDVLPISIALPLEVTLSRLCLGEQPHLMKLIWLPIKEMLLRHISETIRVFLLTVASEVSYRISHDQIVPESYKLQKPNQTEVAH